jgi:hypothetical protein
MTWLIGKSRQAPATLPLMRESPRLLSTAPIPSDFNLSFDVEESVNEFADSTPEFPDAGAANLQAELDAWDSASDEAFEGAEGGLGE